jgi:carboxymethylenebutenolidase
MSTSTPSIETTTIDVSTSEGVADCYFASPLDGLSHPGVLFLMNIHGLRSAIYEMADRIAGHGYVVLAPNMFYRAGRTPLKEHSDAGDGLSVFQRMHPLMQALTLERVAADGEAYLSALESRSDGRVGITGYCFGGVLAWEIAAAHPGRVAVIAGYHTGRMVQDSPNSPHLLAPRVSCEVYWGHAADDPGMTPEQVATLDEAMDAAGVDHTTEIYEGTRHGYTMRDEDAWNEGASERHFETLFDLFGRVLGA